MTRTALFGAAMAVASVGFILPAAAKDFDGQWAVQLQTLSGSCDATLSTTVGVARGRIDESGLIMTSNGSVDEKGRIALQVAGGGHTFAANGKLAARAGSGTWTSPSKQCSGKWVATRT